MTTAVLSRNDAPGSREPRAAQTPTPVRRTGSYWLFQLFPAGALTILWACVCNMVLDLFQHNDDLHWMFTYVLHEALLIFLLSSAVLWLVLILRIALGW